MKTILTLLPALLVLCSCATAPRKPSVSPTVKRLATRTVPGIPPLPTLHPRVTNYQAIVLMNDTNARVRIIRLVPASFKRTIKMAATTTTTMHPFVCPTNYPSTTEFRCTCAKIVQEDAYTKSFSSAFENVPAGKMTVESAHDPKGPWTVVYTDPFTFGAVYFGFSYPLYLDTSPVVIFRMKVDTSSASSSPPFPPGFPNVPSYVGTNQLSEWSEFDSGTTNLGSLKVQWIKWKGAW